MTAPYPSLHKISRVSGHENGASSGCSDSQSHCQRVHRGCGVLAVGSWGLGISGLGISGAGSWVSGALGRCYAFLRF